MENLTRQALPEDHYLQLLGIALCVFNSNNSFMIENILKLDKKQAANWHQLIDLESGRLTNWIRDTVGQHQYGSRAEALFSDLIGMRNRIIHSFQITYEGKQMLATKNRDTQQQFRITEEYLTEFIHKNEELCTLLYKIRGY